MREVEAEHIGTREEELLDHLKVGGSRSESGDLLGRLAPSLGDGGSRRDRSRRCAVGAEAFEVGDRQGEGLARSQGYRRKGLSRR